MTDKDKPQFGERLHTPPAGDFTIVVGGKEMKVSEETAKAYQELLRYGTHRRRGYTETFGKVLGWVLTTAFGVALMLAALFGVWALGAWLWSIAAHL